MAPVIAELRSRLPDDKHLIVNTGQHYERMMSEILLEELDMPAPDHALGVGSGSHTVQTARVMERVEPVILAERPDLVIVPGDVNSTLAVALVTVKLGVRLAHLEAAPQAAGDGSDYSYWWNGSGTTGTVTCDLGASMEMNMFILDLYEHLDPRTPEGYAISVSTDDANWTQVAAGNNPDSEGARTSISWQPR